MSASRFGRVQKAAAVLPLALLSAAWTASLTGAAVPTVNVAAGADTPGLLPDGSSIPAEAIEAPASVSGSDGLTGSLRGLGGNTREIVATSSTNGIPSAALAAYQRAETVINAADPSCHLQWQLVAAIGRVESDHGRFGGNMLDSDGVATPGIYGPPLNGKNNTSLIRDTDAGQYDRDTTFDRAAGPLQFIPSTWSVVGVDADNDGLRNPQDIDDAALATAVYLCSGTDDLATLQGQRASVFRYNHSAAYVDLVISIMNAYLDGDFMQVPDGTTAAGYLSPNPSYNPPPTRPGGPRTSGGSGSGSGSGTSTGSTQAPSSTQPAPSPSGGSSPAPAPAPAPTAPTGSAPTVSVPPVDAPSPPPATVPPADTVLTYAEAVLQCTRDGYVDNPLSSTDPFDVCVKNYTTKP